MMLKIGILAILCCIVICWTGLTDVTRVVIFLTLWFFALVYWVGLLAYRTEFYKLSNIQQFIFNLKNSIVSLLFTIKNSEDVKQLFFAIILSSSFLYTINYVYEFQYFLVENLYITKERRILIVSTSIFFGFILGSVVLLLYGITHIIAAGILVIVSSYSFYRYLMYLLRLLRWSKKIALMMVIISLICAVLLSSFIFLIFYRLFF